ncbi:hypothetical protein [Geomonas edaphica]|uniref:hypothetical protein n=1 Tax=Geomonas edaphica TaxID=2570226 RepID=UPI001C0F5F17|nr:hypothetical protein [Geomonas edaphica]
MDTLDALDTLVTFIAFVALDALRTLGTGIAFDTLRTGQADGTLDALVTLRALRADLPLNTLNALGTGIPLETLDTLNALDALRALETGGAGFTLGGHEFPVERRLVGDRVDVGAKCHVGIAVVLHHGVFRIARRGAPVTLLVQRVGEVGTVPRVGGGAYVTLCGHVEGGVAGTVLDGEAVHLGVCCAGNQSH